MTHRSRGPTDIPHTAAPYLWYGTHLKTEVLRQDAAQHKLENAHLSQTSDRPRTFLLHIHSWTRACEMEVEGCIARLAGGARKREEPLSAIAMALQAAPGNDDLPPPGPPRHTSAAQCLTTALEPMKLPRARVTPHTGAACQPRIHASVVRAHGIQAFATLRFVRHHRVLAASSTPLAARRCLPCPSLPSRERTHTHTNTHTLLSIG